MIINIQSKTQVERDFAYLTDAIANGAHTQVFHEGDIIEIAGIEHVIIGMDVEPGFAHSMTIQRRNKVDDYVFAYNGRANYETSDIRSFLDGTYTTEFPEEFLEAVSPVTIDGMKTEDRFFLLSSSDLDPETTKYPYYRKRENRIKIDREGYLTWWWLRDPDTGSATNPRIVNPSGSVYSGGSANYSNGVAPACILGNR